MSQSVTKQAVPVEFFEQICADQKLRTLVDRLWGCSNIFSWFIPFGSDLTSPADVIKQDHITSDGLAYPFNVFESEEELDRYCTLLEQRLKRLQADDPLLVQEEVFLCNQTDEQIHSYLLAELEAKFPDLDAAEFAYTTIWGGDPIEQSSDLCYLLPDQVRAIADVLHQIDDNDLLRHVDTSQCNSDDWLEECRKTIQALKHCFATASARGQIILTKIT